MATKKRKKIATTVIKVSPSYKQKWRWYKDRTIWLGGFLFLLVILMVIGVNQKEKFNPETDVCIKYFNEAERAGNHLIV